MCGTDTWVHCPCTLCTRASPLCTRVQSEDSHVSMHDKEAHMPAWHAQCRCRQTTNCKNHLHMENSAVPLEWQGTYMHTHTFIAENKKSSNHEQRDYFKCQLTIAPYWLVFWAVFCTKFNGTQISVIIEFCRKPWSIFLLPTKWTRYQYSSTGSMLPVGHTIDLFHSSGSTS